MKRLFGLLALAGLVTFAAPTMPTQAASLIGPGAAAQTKSVADDLAIQVRGGHGGGFHGGGFHGGGFHGGGFRGFHGGGFGGGRFVGGPRFGGPRFAYGPRFGYGPRFVHRRHFFVRRHFWGPYPYFYAAPRYCYRVWTDWGPRRICRYRPWWA
jgi:hypothetical protein